MPVLQIVVAGAPSRLLDHTCGGSGQWSVQTFTIKNVSPNTVNISNYQVDTQSGHNIDRDYQGYSPNQPFALDPQSSTTRGFRVKDIGDPPAVLGSTTVTVKVFFGAFGNYESQTKSYTIYCPVPRPSRRDVKREEPKERRGKQRRIEERRAKKARRTTKARRTKARRTKARRR